MAYAEATNMSKATQSPRSPRQLERLVRFVRRRLWFDRFVATLHDSLLVSMVVMLVLVVLSKLSPALHPAWWLVFSILGGITLLAAILMARVGRPSDGAVAALIDERLELKDRFTTAIHCAHRDDPFAQAALEEATESLNDPTLRTRISTAFAPRLPGGGWIAPVIGLFAGIVWFTVPSGDVFTAEATKDQQTVLAERSAAQESIRNVLEQIEENPALAEELGDISEAFALEESRPDDPKSAEQSRREALRKISDLEQRLDEVVNGERGQSMEALKQALSELDSKGATETKELSEALRTGDFDQAKKALEELAEAMQDPSLTSEQRERMAKELESLAEQLQSAADKKEALKQALQQAGLDPALADNPEALEQALKQATGLNQQQLEQLKKTSKAQESAAQQCENMSKSLDKMAKECKECKGGKAGEQGMQKSLSKAEEMKQMLQMAKSAQGQCQGGSKPGSGSKPAYADMLPSKPTPGQSSPSPDQKMFGSTGFGPKGSGGSGDAPLSATDFSTQLQRENVALQEGGDIISRQLVDSDAPVVGESNLELQQVADTIVRSWEEGVQEQPIPGHLRDVHKHYFGELKKRIDARSRTA
ncbi:MAG: hypothetical protein CBC35_05715, partial [Planctomycetes bacterium TMED75]